MSGASGSSGASPAASFSQNVSLLAVSKRTGFTIYSLDSLDTLEEVYHDDTEEMFIVQTLFSTDLLALVSAGNRGRLCLFQYKKRKELFHYKYLHNIVAVKMNLERLIVILEDSIYVHDIRDMRHLHTIRDTPVNSRGICALCPDRNNSYLAYPGNLYVGLVNIFDTVRLNAVAVFRAHNSPIAAIAFNSSGTLLASASEKGTIIRVFTIKGQRLHEFRRGMKRYAAICSLHFNLSSVYLSCSSNTETVHVFKLDSVPSKEKEMEAKGWMDYFGQVIKTSVSYLPTQVTEVLSQGRDFAVAHLPCTGMATVCALTSVQEMQRLLAVTQDGLLYVYGFDPENGGQCELLRQHRIISLPDETTNTSTEPLIEFSLPSSPSTIEQETESASYDHSNCVRFSVGSNDQASGPLLDLTMEPPVRQTYASVVKRS